MPFWNRGRALKDSSEEVEKPIPTTRAQRRLSKPRTNTNATLAPSRNSQARDSRQSTVEPYESQEALAASSPVDDGEHYDLRKNIRSQTFESLETFMTAAEHDADHSAGDQTPTTASANVSRTNSVGNTPTVRGKLRPPQLSLVSEASHVDVPTAVSILQSLSKTASPEELAALRKNSQKLHSVHC